MTPHIFIRNLSLTLIVSLFLFSFGLPNAQADGGSVYIHDLYPLGAIDPGSPVFFSTTVTGFTDPSYAVSDSFSASGATESRDPRTSNQSGRTDQPSGSLSLPGLTPPAGRPQMPVDPRGNEPND
jgi:hypothetical protein